MERLTERPEWLRLKEHQQEMAGCSVPQLFAEDKKRRDSLSITTASLSLDYSRHRVTDKTLELLCALAEAVDLSGRRQALFSGEIVNATENRPALHTALRDLDGVSSPLPRVSLTPSLDTVHAQMTAISDALLAGEWLGYDGTAITDVVNIGIGGSDLGPRMVATALGSYATDDVRLHFVANVDPVAMAETLEKLRPNSTLFIITSKTFKTAETLQNAEIAKAWLLEEAGSKAAVEKHFLAVTAAVDRATAFGIPKKNVLPMWQGVGGRYSVWSAVGLPVAIAVGMTAFQDLLKGAHDMDVHFYQTPLRENMPVIMALLGVWTINFLGAETQAIIPYAERLREWPAYLQQLDMESNGKRVDNQGHVVDYATGPIVWGGVGTTGQHAFHQLLYQGAHLVPVDFIAVREGDGIMTEQQQLLLANCMAQREALMRGRATPEPYRAIPGNVPSSTLTMQQLTPYSLGALIALYEHKIFTQGVIWNIDSFDQWGVELGKELVDQYVAML